MKIYDEKTRKKIRAFREQGMTYAEIQVAIDRTIPKGSLSYICKGIKLSPEHYLRIDGIIKNNASVAREKAVVANREVLRAKIRHYRDANLNLLQFMQTPQAKLVALAMLYLGEGSKWQGSRAPKLASSSSMILRLYIDLLRECYNIKSTQLRCRVQHRADQNPADLIEYWSEEIGIQKSQFYLSYMDKRTIGNPTKKTDYRGVCTISCAGTHIQLELAEIAGIIGEAVRGIGAVG